MREGHGEILAVVCSAALLSVCFLGEFTLFVLLKH